MSVASFDIELSTFLSIWLNGEEQSVFYVGLHRIIVVIEVYILVYIPYLKVNLLALIFEYDYLLEIGVKVFFERTCVVFSLIVTWD